MANPSRVLVVGAGVCGLAAAVRLLERGVQVTVCDPSSGPGGLASGFAVGGVTVERFYHHLFASDRCAASWIVEMGLAEKLEFLPATMGMYVDKRIFPFGTASSLLRFSPLPPIDRFKLGLRVKRLSAVKDPKDFEDIRAFDWLEIHASAAELERFWIPMLVAKFGAEYKDIAMAWLWARFRARVSTSHGGRERLGYLRGGFQQLSDALAKTVVGKGGHVTYGASVSEIRTVDSNKLLVRTSQGTETEYSGVIWTPSLQVLAKVTAGLPEDYLAKIRRLRYHHALVMVLELERSALPFYWLNVADPNLPFTVAVEHTKLVGTKDYGDRTIVYLGRYLAAEDPLWQLPDEQISTAFVAAASRAFSSEFEKPLATHLFRGPNAQPIIPVGWGRNRPPMETGVPGLIAANMAQIYPWDRGINYSLELGEQAAKLVSVDAVIR